MHIRAANGLTDVIGLLKLGMAYNELHHYWKGYEPDYPRLTGFMLHAVTDKDQCMYVMVEGEEVIGGIWGAVTPQVWTSDVMVRDLFLFVHPDHRTFAGARALVNKLYWWSRTKNVKGLMVGANSGIEDNRAASALYKRMGFTSVGESFYKPIEGD